MFKHSQTAWGRLHLLNSIGRGNTCWRDVKIIRIGYLIFGWCVFSPPSFPCLVFTGHIVGNQMRDGKLIIATKPISIHRPPKHIQKPDPISLRLQRQPNHIRIRRWSSLHLATRISKSRTRRTPQIDSTFKRHYTGILPS